MALIGVGEGGALSLIAGCAVSLEKRGAGHVGEQLSTLSCVMKCTLMAGVPSSHGEVTLSGGVSYLKRVWAWSAWLPPFISVLPK